ncbi:uncharacterized protein LOC131845300 [Achroia grisella]|uniref:uncharacterized protein LOC131845300 n=1 Tax=Achroia grisella TaxID=688607 RepID=UPI0027D2CA27|nr:uncharacterized protein LOC131845300 [Achroia grisella]
MNNKGAPMCSHDEDVNIQTISQDNQDSEKSTEIIPNSNDEKAAECINLETPKSFSISSSLSPHVNQLQNSTNTLAAPLSFVFCNNSSVITNQPCLMTNLSSPMEIILKPGQPQSLFLQALSKLNESSTNVSVLKLDNRKTTNEIDLSTNQRVIEDNSKSPELSPPDSLCSAPPSYSFVLRQMTIRRRPRIISTFIPSSSFVHHTPPPHYAASFDIFLDTIPIPAPRVHHFGFTPMPALCPVCGYTGMTVVTTKITLCTHFCAIILCLLCCWICAPLPYILRSCKNVSH